MTRSALLEASLNWNPPESWPAIVAIDTHTEGEPLRIILSGYPELKAPTILERRNEAAKHYDNFRTALLMEPRGHNEMYGCVITPPVTADAHFGVLFLHNEGYSTMCGHAVIAVTTVALETGMTSDNPLLIDTPAGLVCATAKWNNGRVASVRFANVPCFVHSLDLAVEVPGIGHVVCDIAYGGAYYAYVDAGRVGLSLMPRNAHRIVEYGMAIKHEIAKTIHLSHPTHEDLGFLYGTIFVGLPESSDADRRNVCVFADGQVDRSPTGTGVSGLAALLIARKEAEMNQPLRIESIIGTQFVVRATAHASIGAHTGIIPEVEGRAFITGRHQFLLDPADPLKHGFSLH